MNKKNQAIIFPIWNAIELFLVWQGETYAS
jgi:hypothetical protein